MLKADLEAVFKGVSDLKTQQSQIGDCAVAFSGGGDSTALLHALRNHRRVTHAFIIDHNLRDGSAVECAEAADFARALGYKTFVKCWDHDQPKTGIQAKARNFRYAAMGALCREFGISYLLTAHTNDDQAETVYMRQNRGTGWRGLAGMKAQAYGPIWPALVDVTVYRPLLGQSREALRRYNRSHDLNWAEDPSNKNTAFTRVRAREVLANNPAFKTELLSRQIKAAIRLSTERASLREWMNGKGRVDAQGYFSLTETPPTALLGIMLRIASGSGGPIEKMALDGLHQAMQVPDFTAATLAGAWVVKCPDGFIITRDKVAAKGRRDAGVINLHKTTPLTGEPYIWDGRFLVSGETKDVTVEPVLGAIDKMRDWVETKNIFSVPACVRPTLPLFRKSGVPIGFGAGEFGGVSVSSLAPRRMVHFWDDK